MTIIRQKYELISLFIYEAKILNELLGFFPARKSIFVESYKLKIYEKDNLTKTKEIFILIFSIKFSPKFIL